ncbi:hypothetical protein DOTSEDRAFT_109758, partial [Dothistroma septosporum NZE10]
MANLYNLEPQPTAKVILNTTSGDIELSLFAKQTPLAARNFLQHCLDGYYTNTIFHRLVPSFIVQGGDPTGTGQGGESALENGGTFEDEFHSRLKYNRRGLLGMANEGPNSNGSQFFFTLDATPELQGKNTMFGRVEGDTIYNLMKMSQGVEMGSEGSERPLYPTEVTGTEILVNPFEDMVARVKEAPRSKEEKTGVKKRKKPMGKQVLSFGGDEEEQEMVPIVKKVKANPKLVAVESEKMEGKVAKSQKKEKTLAKPDEEAVVPGQDIAKPLATKAGTSVKLEEVEESEEESETEEDRRKRKLDQTNAEIQALKASMKRRLDVKPQIEGKPKPALEAMIPTTSTRGRKRGKAKDEKGAFNLFQSFKQRLETLPTESVPTNDTSKDHLNPEPTSFGEVDDDEEAALCDLHFIANCQSCRSWNDEKPDGEAEKDGDDDPGWMAHTLTFAKDTLGKDLEWKRKMEEIEVIDPREKARTIKEEQRKGKE